MSTEIQESQATNRRPRLLHRVVFALRAVAVLLAVVGVIGFVTQGRLNMTLADHPWIGLAPNSEVTFHLAIRNTTRHPVRIVCADDRCDDSGCSVMDGLPLTIPPGDSQIIAGLFKTRPSPYSYRLTFTTDDPDQPEVAVDIAG